MLEIYYQWIDNNYPSHDIAYRKCKEAVEEMQKMFPELIITKGIYVDCFDVKHTHWWLKTESGSIIDPTFRQFIDVGNGSYKEHVGEEPTGKCIYCGEYVYASSGYSVFCSKDCYTLKKLIGEFNKLK